MSFESLKQKIILLNEISLKMVDKVKREGKTVIHTKSIFSNITGEVIVKTFFG